MVSTDSTKTFIKKNKKVLFVSSYLSAQSGSLCVSEKIAIKLNDHGICTGIVSRTKNKIIRILDIIVSLFKSDAKVIHIDVYSGQAFLITEIATLIGSWLGKKQVLTLHGGALPEFYPQNAKRIKKAFDRAHLITTPSKMLQLFFEDKGFKIQYIPNSIELEKFPYDRSAVQPFSLLWVRAFDSIYNPGIAVEAFYRVLKDYPEATLTMIGPDKGILNETIQLINELGIKAQVKIIGPVPNEKLYEYYQSHEIFLNTTSYESFGVAVLEAAACGIPIVSSKVGEIPTLWKNGYEILMTEEITPEAFKEKIVKIFEDEGLKKLLSENAFKKAELYSWDRIKDLWISTFNNFMA